MDDQSQHADTATVTISSTALHMLEAIATVREMTFEALIDELAEQGRTRLAPKPKAPTAGRGRKAKDNVAS